VKRHRKADCSQLKNTFFETLMLSFLNTDVYEKTDRRKQHSVKTRISAFA
jgi:hypothetical protein